MRHPTVRKDLGMFRNSTVSVERYLTGGGFLIKLVPKPRLWETVHLLCKVARNPPAAHLQNFSSGLHRRGRFGKMPLFFIIPLSLSHLIHISWRALEVWNCLKLIHYWIFSPRLKSLASLTHNSVPIDCLGPNISQGCTEHFSRDFLKLYQRGCSALSPCKWYHPEWVFVRLLHLLSTVRGLFRLMFILPRHSRLVITMVQKPHLHTQAWFKQNSNKPENSPWWSR